MSAFDDDLKTEKSHLLPPGGPDVSKGEFSGQSIEQEEMQKTTHNDPIAKRQDMQHLFGSTRILHNVIVNHSQERLSLSVRHVAEAHQNGAPVSKSPVFAKAYAENRKYTVLFLEKVKHDFFRDARSLAEGTIPQSVVLALIIGVVCGVACWIYYSALSFFLDLIWEKIPEKFVEGHWHVQTYWMYIPLASFILCTNPATSRTPFREFIILLTSQRIM